MKAETIRNLIVVSDLHCGCGLGLCPSKGMRLDENGRYRPSALQRKVWSYWREFWDAWVPLVTRGEDYAVLVNGDALDGRHHGATTQISQNLSDQAEIAYQVLRPVVEACKGRYYHIRGTEAHSGPAGEEEEKLAQRLGALPNEVGQYARYELWKRVGEGLVHALHHIGTTGSSAHEASAVNAELTAEFNEAARWHEQVPDVVVRSHRHRHIEVQVPTARGYGIACVTPGWQLRTPFSWRIAGGRLAPPQFGGTLVRWGNEDGIYTRHKVWHIGRSRVE